MTNESGGGPNESSKPSELVPPYVSIEVRSNTSNEYSGMAAGSADFGGRGDGGIEANRLDAGLEDDSAAGTTPVVQISIAGGSVILMLVGIISILVHRLRRSLPYKMGNEAIVLPSARQSAQVVLGRPVGASDLTGKAEVGGVPVQHLALDQAEKAEVGGVIVHDLASDNPVFVHDFPSDDAATTEAGGLLVPPSSPPPMLFSRT